MKKYISFFRKIVAFSLLLAILFTGANTNNYPIDKNYGISLCSNNTDNEEPSKN